MAKRTAGEGTIRKRSDGRWEARLRDPETGRRKSVFGRTKVEASKKLQEMREDVVRGVALNPSTRSTGDFIDHWLENIHALNVSEGHLVNLKCIWEKHIKPVIGDVQLSKLRAAHLDKLMGEMKRKGASNSRREKAYMFLSPALRHAVSRGLIHSNPLDTVMKPRLPAPEVRTFTVDQVKALLEKADGDPLHALYVLALTVGLRQGELFALDWADVDLKAGTITVRHSQAEVEGKLIIKPPKSGKARAVPIGAAAIAALRQHPRRLKDSRIFTTPNGRSLRRSNFIRRSWKPLLRRAKLSDSETFKTCRSTVATLMAKVGVQPRVVQTVLGHAELETTLKFYTAVDGDQLIGAASALQAALGLD